MTAVQAGPPVADRVDRGDRGGQGRAARGTPADGAAILNADDPIVRRMGDRLGGAEPSRYGFAADADIGAEAVESAGTDGHALTSAYRCGRRPVTIPTLGRLSVHNALAGAAVGRGRRANCRRDREGLAAGWSAPHRVQLVRLGGVTIVDDSLQRIAAVGGRRARPAGRAARPAGAVLGEMLELGEASDEGHRVVGEAAARARSTGWWWSGPMRRRSPRVPCRREWTRAASFASATPRRPSTCCRPACATATSCWSRRRAGSASTGWSTASGANLAGRRAHDDASS